MYLRPYRKTKQVTQIGRHTKDGGGEVHRNQNEIIISKRIMISPHSTILCQINNYHQVEAEKSGTYSRIIHQCFLNDQQHDFLDESVDAI